MNYSNELNKTAKCLIALLVFAILLIVPRNADANSRIKDITDFEGVRENQLVGYGLVAGLNGTGDNIKSMAFTRESLVAMLERLGVNARDGQLKSKNIAAVMVTANLPPFARQGSRVDVTVSALGDATDHQGGTLLVTPLMGADGEVYAVAQGQLAVGGFQAKGSSQTINKGVPTSARIASGAIIEREILFKLNNLKDINIALKNPDFTTSKRISDAINVFLGSQFAKPIDSGTVNLIVPEKYKDKIVSLMTQVEQLKVQPDQLAKVVIDENSGIIVIGQNVKIDKVAIAQGNLTIKVTEKPLISQPSPFSDTGETVIEKITEIEVDEEKNKQLDIVNTGINLQELVDGLNSLGVGPRDMISILQAIKASGSLQADIEVM